MVTASSASLIFMLRVLSEIFQRLKMKVKWGCIQNETQISLTGMAPGDMHLELPELGL